MSNNIKKQKTLQRMTTMKNILVTGGCGFIASHFINFIFDNDPDINIVNIDAMYYCANENNVRKDIQASQRYKLIKSNLCFINQLEGRVEILHVLEENKINVVVHFAAQSHVQNSFDDSISYTFDNVLGTHCLLEACRIYDEIEKFIHISTDEVYGESMLYSQEKKTENSILSPTNPYAATKASAELIAKSYYYSFKMPIIITRGNNVYGPNQYPEKLIPKFIQLLQKGKKVTIQGDGSNVRGFLHVQDVVKAIDIVLKKGIIGEIYNIGSDEHHEFSVMEIAKTLIKKIKNTENYDEHIEYVEDRPFNDKRYYISNDKMKELGWNIEIEFLDGLQSLI